MLLRSATLKGTDSLKKHQSQTAARMAWSRVGRLVMVPLSALGVSPSNEMSSL